MPIGTRTDVEEILKVQDSNGVKQAPATGAYGRVFNSGIDLDANGNQTETLDVPDRAAAVVVAAKFSNDGHVEVRFTDGNNNVLVPRTPTENPDYSVTGGGQVFVETAVASPYIEVAFIDDTAAGTANTVTWTVYVR